MSIEIQKVSKRFEEKKVLEDINFEFETGKINMIIGASGSGKSVLIKCIVGLMRPEEGSILFDGQDLLQLNERETRNLRRNIGMLFQGSALFDSMTVGENVGFPLRMFTHMTQKEQDARINELLGMVNMPNTAHLYPSEISGGMKKRVGIARAIALSPKYLFCDEPNSGLDPQTAEVIDDLLQKLTRHLGITTIVVSHDMKSVMTIGDKVLFIYKGHNAWQGYRKDIFTAQNEVLRDFIETSGVTIESMAEKEAEEAEK